MTHKLFKIKTMQIVYMGRLYKVIGYPSIAQDSAAMVEVWMAENNRHSGYWRSLRYGKKRLDIVDHTQRVIKAQFSQD